MVRASQGRSLSRPPCSLLRSFVVCWFVCLCVVQAKDFFEKNYGPTHKRTANAYNNLGVLYQKTREFEKALTVGLKSLQISQETMGKTSAAVATALNNLGALYSEMGKSDIALKFYKKSLAIDEDKYGTDHPKVAITCNNLGAV